MEGAKDREARAEAVRRKLLGLRRWKYETGHWRSEKCVGVGYYRSSLELRSLRLLDAAGCVTKYAVGSVRIPYVKRRKRRHYVVDLDIRMKSGERALVEVKPLWKLHWRDTKAKAVAGFTWSRRMGGWYSIWTERDIRRYERDGLGEWFRRKGSDRSGENLAEVLGVKSDSKWLNAYGKRSEGK